jgi:hypothetical protein
MSSHSTVQREIAAMLHTLAIATPFILLLYLAVTDWVNLRPWNDREALPIRQKLLISAANYTPLVFIGFAFTTDSLFLALVATVFALIDFAMHIAYWWVPYFFGASEQQQAEYDQLFGHTLRVLPRIGNHPVPNAEHTVVGILMVIMSVSAIVTTAGLIGL